MAKNTGKVREFCQCAKAGTLFLKGDLSFMKSYVVTQNILESHLLVLTYGK